MTVTTPLSTERPRLVKAHSGNWRVEIPNGIPPSPAAQQGDVSWYVPYTKVHEATVAGAPTDARWIDVSASPDAYYWALREIWAKAETFALLEHDIVCRPDVVEALDECPEPWCVFLRDDYCHPECQESWANQLSTTRFSKELIAAVPDAMSAIPAEGWHWTNMCDGLGGNLRAAGFKHHWHGEPVHHHRMGRS